MGNKIMAFECGLYKSYDCKIKRKYSQDRSPVILPEEFTCLIVPDCCTKIFEELCRKSLAALKGRNDLI